MWDLHAGTFWGTKTAAARPGARAATPPRRPRRPAGSAPELVGEPTAQLPVAAERLALPARPVQTEHQLPGEPLVQRVSRDGRGHLVEHPGMPAAPQRKVVALQLGAEPRAIQGRPAAVQPRRVQHGKTRHRATTRGPL